MNYDFPTHISGDTWRGVSTITIIEKGSALNLTDCDVFMQFRTRFNLASPVYLELSTYNEKIEIVSYSGGVVKIPPQIIDIPSGDYVYDLQINFPTGKSKTYLKGSFKILPDTTRTSSDPINIYSPLYDQKLIISTDDDRILTSDGERLNYI